MKYANLGGSGLSVLHIDAAIVVGGQNWPVETLEDIEEFVVGSSVPEVMLHDSTMPRRAFRWSTVNPKLQRRIAKWL